MSQEIKMEMQRGVALLEAMVALLIFSFGILGLVGLQAVAIKNTGDAKLRADASFLANQIIAQMWADQLNLASYAHRPNAGADVCSPAGSASANGNVTAWVAEITRVLPGATSTNQQITVNAATGAVTVTVCWRANQETTDHNHVVTAQVRNN